MFRNFWRLLLILAFISKGAGETKGQAMNRVYKSFIATPQLYVYGNQQGLPLYSIGGSDRLMLEFDDLEGGVKSYYYTFQLCDYNWRPANLSPFDYLKGFTQVRIATYRYSSVALTRYTHYQAILPDKDCIPVRSGNYLLKVFLDGDTSKLVLTRQMLVVEPKAILNAEVVQAFTHEKFRTHQKLRFAANIKDLNTFSAAQQVKAVLLQNNRWDIAQRDIVPTFVRGNSLEFNSESIGIFTGGLEWRWADLRGFRLQSDRVDSASYQKNSTEIFMKTDKDRSLAGYQNFPDLNGSFWITTYESINPAMQGDYATVHFSFQSPDGKLYEGKDLYLSGQFTDYSLTDQWKMKYNENTGQYELKAFLKQGYYNYTYLLKNPYALQPLEANYWDTENNYTILIYYKGFNDRCDQLIGAATLNSHNNRPGLSF